MSEEKHKDSPHSRTADQTSDRQTLALTVNKATNEITFTDPSGQVFVIEPRVIEPEVVAPKPLTLEEFRDVLDQLQALGVQWSRGIPPIPIVENVTTWNESSQQKYVEIQKKYPRFPTELNYVILHALLGRPTPAALVGNDAILKQKAAFVAS